MKIFEDGSVPQENSISSLERQISAQLLSVAGLRPNDTDRQDTITELRRRLELTE